SSDQPSGCPEAAAFQQGNDGWEYHDAATNFTVRGRILNAWCKYGGTKTFGHPIEDARDDLPEKNLTDAQKNTLNGCGQPGPWNYSAQLFQRNRIEYHPVNQTLSPDFVNLFGNLGKERLTALGRGIASLPADLSAVDPHFQKLFLSQTGPSGPNASPFWKS